VDKHAKPTSHRYRV
jgi:hypothetical protein